MRPTRELAALLAVVGLSMGAAGEEPAADAGMFGLRADFGGRGPVTITAASLDYDYKRNIITYRGKVSATQDEVRIQSDVLTITLRDDRGTPTASERGAVTLQEIVASGHVRIEQGERWATGGKAVFDQPKRILLLTESPVLHDGPNEVAGERVVVYLDEDRSVVEGGSRRVKAVLYPDRDDEAPAR